MTIPGKPDRIGRYEVHEHIGRGGMGAVYRGRDTLLDREVAIKVMHPDLLADPSARERFFREARSAARLLHRNIVTLFEFAEDGATSYIVTEFLRGETLAARLAKQPPLTLEAKLDIVAQLAAGLQFAHAHGVVHRDVKPANVWLQEDGTVKLLDFGIAKLVSATSSECGKVMGSVPYLSPEQIDGRPVDARSDIFSAGVVLYELVVGRRPFEGDSPTVVMMKILQEDPPPLVVAEEAVPATLVAVVRRALEKDPARRYASAGEFATDVLNVRHALIAAREPETVRLAAATPSADAPVEAASDVLRRPESASPPPSIDLDLRPWAMEPGGDGTHGLAGPAAGRRWWRLPLVAGLAVLVLVGTWFLAAGGPQRLVFGSWRSARSDAKDASERGGAGTRGTADEGSTTVPLRITSDPPGAAITIDGEDMQHVTPSEIRIDGSHPHRIRLVKPGYQPAEAPVTAEILQAGLFRLQLQEIPRAVTFIAYGPYAFEVVEGDRVLSAAAERHVLTLTGRHTLHLRATEYLLDTPVTLDAARGERVERRVPDLGTLLITLDTALGNCRLRLGARDLGYEPFSPVLVAPGNHVLALDCPGAPKREVPVTVEAGEQKRMSLR